MIFLLGARPKNVFCGFTEKYFGANGVSPGIPGPVIAYLKKIAQKERDFFCHFKRGGFFLDKKPERGGGSCQISKT